jgi:hypothetical protein
MPLPPFVLILIESRKLDGHLTWSKLLRKSERNRGAPLRGNIFYSYD